ncbi:expressed unknown protein [Seminavis robusta]|uniref:Uncharacterized protein n=1 Tax=Seminavis robusta TaxID=568900 RepID=A0A9N8EXH8_9STRA|nr:expressed unknown protein [Seminavis robusta]|eukprot:Sro2161_g317130.1 n/a (340) ;mRNA; r:11600-12772
MDNIASTEKRLADVEEDFKTVGNDIKTTRKELESAENDRKAYCRHLLRGVTIPTTLEALWALLSSDSDIAIIRDQGKAAVLSSTGKWESMTNATYSVQQLQKDQDNCYNYQVKRFDSPKTNPSVSNEMGTKWDEVELREQIKTLFSDNPFLERIPDRHNDQTIADVKEFLMARPTDPADDAKAQAALFAMPGSGKTRSIREAAQTLGAKHERWRLCDFGFSEIDELVVNAIAQCNEDELLIVHFDEVQVWLDSHGGEAELQNLAAKCSTRGNQNRMLKFIFTGTPTSRFTSEVISGLFQFSLLVPFQKALCLTCTEIILSGRWTIHWMVSLTAAAIIGG